ncbi:MAG: FimV/HubP family polar landmark protein [Woeseiaceae bacterium]|nr:FimV/HubP family polar landmark protein [Woeseiaceae bacterium]
MSPRLNRVWPLAPFLLFTLQAWALGLGDIRLSSVLNEPLWAEIELLAVTPEELNNLTVQLAAQETFQRYGLDRPMFLASLRFEIEKSGRASGNIIRVTSAEPITEPFITFLVEATWSRGRLLREYTLLMDLPTFAPPPTTLAGEPVTAPTRTAPADSGQIERPVARSQTSPAEISSLPAVALTLPVEEPAAADSFGEPTFDSTPGGDRVVVRGDTLWRIAQEVRPDDRLTFNQTMLAIFDANPQAFDGNINRLRAGATLRIPSADDVFRISSGIAVDEILRQNVEWGGEGALAPALEPPPPVADLVVYPLEAQPSLTLVPPDDEDDLILSDTSVDSGAEATVDDIVDPVQERISEIGAILDDPSFLIAIADNELAALRQELADLRGDEIFVDDGVAGEDAEPFEDFVDEELAPAVQPALAVVSQPARDEGIVDTILGYLNNFWVWIGGALVLTVGVLFWFIGRAARRDDEGVTGVWDALDIDDMGDDEAASTERPKALARDDDEAIIVVETETKTDSDFIGLNATLEVPAAEESTTPESTEMPGMETMTPAPEVGETFEIPVSAVSPGDATGVPPSLEDTFSSETGINLDQSDPIAEADFHMAYGLYDQAADLINGALGADPDRQDLLAKLCEIYFVWGNRDAFIDAAQRMDAEAGYGAQAEWDKIVIMGQQIAADHELFSGVSAEGVSKAVDLSFGGGVEDVGELDMDFSGAPDADSSDVIDLGADSEDDVVVADETWQALIPPDSGLDVDFSLDDNAPQIPPADATAEIDLDDLGLDLDALEESALAADVADTGVLSDFENTAIGHELEIADGDLEATGNNKVVSEDELLAETGRHEAVDINDIESTGTREVIEAEDRLVVASETAVLGDDEATKPASLDDEDDFEVEDVGIDSSLLEATGQTQVLKEDMAVEPEPPIESNLSGSGTTIFSSGPNDEEGDFDFEQTEALPKDVFSPTLSSNDTGNMRGLVGSTDMDLDLDLDELTAALKVSEAGATVNQVHDDPTVEQPRFKRGDDGVATQSLSPDDMSGKLHEARTMTEVGTKLDLARAYVDMGDLDGALSILEEVLDGGDAAQKQQAQQLIDSLPT